MFPLKGKKAIGIKELADKPFISLCEDDYPGTRDWLVKVCQEEGFAPKITHESNSTSTLIHLVALKMGVSLLPESCLRLSHEGTVFHPMVEEVYAKTYLIWCKKDFSLPLQHHVRIVSDCFGGKQTAKVKALPSSHPEKKLATDGKLEEVLA